MKINTAIALGSTSVVAFWLKGADDETQRRAGDCDLKGHEAALRRRIGLSERRLCNWMSPTPGWSELQGRALGRTSKRWRGRPLHRSH